MVKGRDGWFLNIDKIKLTDLHNQNPDVGKFMFCSAPRRWIDLDLTSYVTVSIQCRVRVLQRYFDYVDILYLQ